MKFSFEPADDTQVLKIKFKDLTKSDWAEKVNVLFCTDPGCSQGTTKVELERVDPDPEYNQIHIPLPVTQEKVYVTQLAFVVRNTKGQVRDQYSFVSTKGVEHNLEDVVNITDKSKPINEQEDDDKPSIFLIIMLYILLYFIIAIILVIAYSEKSSSGKLQIAWKMLGWPWFLGLAIFSAEEE